MGTKKMLINVLKEMAMEIEMEMEMEMEMDGWTDD